MHGNPPQGGPQPLSLGLAEPDPTAVDPVCGMAVPVSNPAGGTEEHDGATYYFCSRHCRSKFVADPEAVLSAKAPASHDCCGHPAATAPAAPAKPGTKYTCPMHPEVIADGPGPCPKCGMALEPVVPTADDGDDPELRDMTRRLIVGVALGVPLLFVAMGDMAIPGEPLMSAFGHGPLLVAQAVLATPIVLWCGWPFFARAWASVRTRNLNMFTLVALGVGAAYLYSLAGLVAEFAGMNPLASAKLPAADLPETVAGHVADVARVATSMDATTIRPYFESAATIVVLVLVGQVLELRARMRTGEAVRKLLRLAPKTARVVRPGGAEEDVPLEGVHIGDVVRVRPGERVPVDGVVKEGTTAIDESMLTGEFTPVGKGPGDKVVAGSQNGVGAVLVEAVRVADDTLLAQMVHLVGKAQRTRVPIQQRVDEIASRFVPAVIGIAILTFGLWAYRLPGAEGLSGGFLSAVGVLIIACPCALGLAAPLALVVGMGRGAGIGVLFRDAAALERLGVVDTLCVDKTGTLTEGKPKLVAVAGVVGVGPDEVLAKAAAVERGSEHPIGQAIVWEAYHRKLTIPRAEGVSAVPGKGIRGTVDGKTVLVGAAKYLRENGVTRDLPDSEVRKQRDEGRGIVLVAEGNRALGVIALADPVRPTSAEAVKILAADGVHSVLLTGDHEATAHSVARDLGIAQVIADTLPAEKWAVIDRLKNEGKVVAMAGDGINDAPALAAADVGIALGSGTDIAITAAPVTLVRPDLRAIAAARNLSRATVATIRQNLFLAFVYNVLAIPIAAGALVPLGGGRVSPELAAAAMSLSSASVVLNSLRLARKRL